MQSVKRAINSIRIDMNQSCFINVNLVVYCTYLKQ